MGIKKQTEHILTVCRKLFKESIHTTIGQVQDSLVESFQNLEGKLKEKDKVMEEQKKELDKLKNTVKELNDREMCKCHAFLMASLM